MTSAATTEGKANWLTKVQLTENLSNLRAATLGNLLNSLITVALFAGDLPPAYLAGGFGLMAFLLWMRARIAKAFLSATDDATAVHKAAIRVDLIAAALGAAWGGSITALFVIATPAQQMFLGILAAGMMNAGTATFRTRQRAAILYLAMFIPGLLISFVQVNTTSGLAALGLLVSYTVFLYSQIRLTAERFNTGAHRERDLSQSNETIALLLNDFTEQGSDWLFELDADVRLLQPSSRLAQACCRPVETLIAKPFLDLFDHGAERGVLAGHFRRSRPFRHQVVSLTVGDAQHWWSISARPVGDGHWRGVCSDITAQRHAEEKVSYMAHYDGLTDLPNRFMLSESLYHALNRDEGVAGLLCLDLDNFKVINDTLGHPVGDKLLKAVARRLESCAPSSEVVSRLGGDEFAILIPASHIGSIADMAQSIIDALSEPFSLGDHDVVIGTSIGIALAPQDGDNVDALLRNADLALYSAKALGRNRAVWFEPGMDEAAQARRLIEMDLRSALGKRELKLHYQALVDMETEQTSGYEALIRWEHPVRGTVMPDVFIPIAEETGLIIQIGEWVIRQAVHDLSTWEPHIGVAINLSPAQMRSPSLIATIANAIARTGVDPARICLEITETVLMQDTDVNIETLHMLRALGVQVALDDFGTGYSSLNYLRSFPFSKIKIDRCFISDIDSREDCQAIVRSVVGLANSLGMKTTAEGVERTEQMDMLRVQGCNEVQGFLFSRAVALEELSDLRKSADKAILPRHQERNPVVMTKVGTLNAARRAA
ncbi:MAG: EAL domain-containing protein [Sphingomonadales bacterium]|jgi:diguanylate cyclase (GGDEF)-like protein|nr:EAL domain-containing protein [Sphingomonadales bacterium]